MYLLVDITVSFSEFYYSVGEDDDLVELAVKLSKTLPNDVTVQVLNNDGTAVGKSTSISRMRIVACYLIMMYYTITYFVKIVIYVDMISNLIVY